MGYREKIYGRYASLGGTTGFDREAAVRWHRAVGYHFRGLLPPPPARVLDIACGQGAFLFHLMEEGYPNPVGVDISPEQVAIARTVADDVHQEDAMSFLDAHPGEFDAVVGLDIIEHFNKDEVFEFLAKVHRALRPGGVLVMTTPNGNHLFASEPLYFDFTHEVCFTPNSMTQVLETSGFDVVRFREGGPAPIGVKSAVRYALWRSVVRPLIKAYNFVELGHGGGGVFTRNFIVQARRRES